MVFEPIKTPFTYSFFHKRKNVNGVLKFQSFLIFFTIYSLMISTVVFPLPLLMARAAPIS